MKCTIVALVVVALAAMSQAAPSPGFAGPLVYAAFPAPSSDTKVVRDALGNQATSYAYQDGHSSAVAVSRSDVSKHLVAAPVVYHAAPAIHHVAPVAAAPVAYHHPYAAAAPFATAYHGHAAAYPAYHDYHHYAAAPAYYY